MKSFKPQHGTPWQPEVELCHEIGRGKTVCVQLVDEIQAVIRFLPALCARWVTSQPEGCVVVGGGGHKHAVHAELCIPLTTPAYTSLKRCGAGQHVLA